MGQKSDKLSNSVRQRNYHRALEILDEAVQKNVAAKRISGLP